MSKLKLLFKAALPFVIAGIVGVVVGIIFLLIDGFEGGALAIVGGLLALIGVVCFFMAWSKARFIKRAICTECNKFFSDTDKDIEYSYTCTAFKPIYNKSSGNIEKYEYAFTVTIVCPHCGSTVTFAETRNGKTESEAAATLDSWIKSLLKYKKNDGDKSI